MLLRQGHCTLRSLSSEMQDILGFGEGWGRSFGPCTLVFSTDICRGKDAVGGCEKDASRWVAMELGFHSGFDPQLEQLTC